MGFNSEAQEFLWVERKHLPGNGERAVFIAGDYLL